jgi:hypothetical protein
MTELWQSYVWPNFFKEPASGGVVLFYCLHELEFVGYGSFIFLKQIESNIFR